MPSESSYQGDAEVATLTVEAEPSKLRSLLIVAMSLVATYGAVVGIVAATPGL
jgi:hypothetical protein